MILGGGQRLAKLLESQVFNACNYVVVLDDSKDNTCINIPADNIISFKKIKEKSFDILIACNYSKFIASAIISQAQIGTLNFHAGYLPNYRGGSAYQWQFLNAEPKLGISILEIGEFIDTGRVYAEGFVDNVETKTFYELQKCADELFKDIFVGALENLLNQICIKHIGRMDGKIWLQRSSLDSRLNKTYANVTGFLRLLKLLQYPYPKLYIETTTCGKISVNMAKKSEFIFGSFDNKIFYFSGRFFINFPDGAVELLDFEGDHEALKKGTYCVL